MFYGRSDVNISALFFELLEWSYVYGGGSWMFSIKLDISEHVSYVHVKEFEFF